MDVKTILVTGGAGFIGSHIVDLLIDKGHNVIVIDNLSTGKRENLNSKAEFYLHDIAKDKYKKIAYIFSKYKIDIVIHLAAQVSVRDSIDNPDNDANINIMGIINLLKNCKNVEKIIFSSSGGTVYGDPEELPCPESHSINPVCPYGISKYSAEMYIKLYESLYDMNYTILRYSNVYGPRQDGKGEAGVVAIFLENILQDKKCTINGDGEQTRDFVYVKDVAMANFLAMSKGDNEIINIGSGEETSVYEVFDMLSGQNDFVPVHLPAIKGEILRSVLDVNKAKEILGWEPKTSFEEGIKQLLSK